MLCRGVEMPALPARALSERLGGDGTRDSGLALGVQVVGGPWAPLGSTWCRAVTGGASRGETAGTGARSR